MFILEQDGWSMQGTDWEEVLKYYLLYSRYQARIESTTNDDPPVIIKLGSFTSIDIKLIKHFTSSSSTHSQSFLIKPSPFAHPFVIPITILRFQFVNVFALIRHRKPRVRPCRFGTNTPFDARLSQFRKRAEETGSIPVLGNLLFDRAATPPYRLLDPHCWVACKIKACGMGRRSRWPASRVLWNCDLCARVKWDGADPSERWLDEIRTADLKMPTHIACLASALKKFPSSTISGNHTDHYLNGRFRSNEIEPIELPIPNALAHNKVIAINTDLIMMAANQQARIS
ncbi:hypothetical protein PGT21_036011 [Puccinia graminis f. sp. tritici]|uniref:Uncharacterized protein n=1 Tax=Puccinia graminis f. sp. tritici TaxID=56615 RepID=A0A5B0P0S5_PUCGR|nr:hypothetical protein PGT21_036011 [Puccinia graminis f. sp. tritici]